MKDDQPDSVLSECLAKIYNSSMILPPYAGRIIHYGKYSVQHLKCTCQSYPAKILESLPPKISKKQNRLLKQLPTIVTLPMSIGLLASSTQAKLPVQDISNQEPDNDNDPKKVGTIYARVSTEKQIENKNHHSEDGISIESQVEMMEEMAEQNGIELPYDPITDRAKSGMNFERDGIKEVVRKAVNGEITHLLVEDISRIGRHAPQTLHLIYSLQRECGVTIISKKGNIDTREVEGLLDTVLSSLMAHVVTHERIEKSHDRREYAFKKNKNWKSRSKYIPIGYEEREDGWIKKDPSEVPIVEELFEVFLSEGTYAAATTHINEEYEDVLTEPVSTNRVKNALTNPVYIGEPEATVGEKKDEDREYIEDSDLRIINESIFNRVQKEVEKISEKYSSETESTVIEDLVGEFGFGSVEKVCPDLKAHCSDCGSLMVKNGQRGLDGELEAINFLCPDEDCGKQRRVPYLSELEKLRKE